MAMPMKAIPIAMNDPITAMISWVRLRCSIHLSFNRTHTVLRMQRPPHFFWVFRHPLTLVMHPSVMCLVLTHTQRQPFERARERETDPEKERGRETERETPHVEEMQQQLLLFLCQKQQQLLLRNRQQQDAQPLTPLWRQDRLPCFEPLLLKRRVCSSGNIVA